jgi:hypothetical protein
MDEHLGCGAGHVEAVGRRTMLMGRQESAAGRARQERNVGRAGARGGSNMGVVGGVQAGHEVGSRHEVRRAERRGGAKRQSLRMCVHISAIYSSTSESASGGGWGVPNALTGGLVLTVVKGVNKWSCCVLFGCHRERRRRRVGSDMQW